MKLTLKIYLLVIISCLTWLEITEIARSQNATINQENREQCPHDLSELASLLVSDISNYANRIIQKSSRRLKQEDQQRFLPVYIILASQPELEPITIKQTQYREVKESQIEQIFFTTLERQYPGGNRIIETQHYHWLLLTPSQNHWQMVMLLTRFGIPNNSSIYTPPQDSTEGVMGRAIKLWLRDCWAKLEP